MAADVATASLSCISKGTRISGTVHFGETATIEGEVEGEITGDNIEIASSAVVTARITTNRLKVSGQVDGEIVARGRIELMAAARLGCTITTPTLVVTEGAQFDGDCKMPGGPTSSPESESHEAKGTEVSSLITEAQKAELRERGYSDTDIALMIPGVCASYFRTSMNPRHACAMLLGAFGSVQGTEVLLKNDWLPNLLQRKHWWENKNTDDRCHCGDGVA